MYFFCLLEGDTEVMIDLIMSLAIFGFVPALIPTLVSKDKPHRASCLLTATLLTVISVCFALKKMWLPFGSEVAGAVAWWLLLVQPRRKNERI